MNLSDKVVVVTGASQGLGRAIAKRLASEGAQVALVARSEDLLAELKEEITEEDGIAEYFICNVSKFGQIRDTVSEILERFSTIDILINNAGIWSTDELEAEDPEKNQDVFAVNSLGPIHFTYEILPILQKKNDGYIFNVLSISGASDTPGAQSKEWMTYSASKWALRGFTKSLRDLLVDSKIKITSLYPGGIDTNIFQNPGEGDIHNHPWMMKVEDVVDVIVFALTRPIDVQIEEVVVTKK